MNARCLARLTAIAHVVLAAGIAGHARLTDRDAGNWPLMTLATGIVGVVGYVRSIRNGS